MFTTELGINRFLVEYTRNLVAGVDDSRLADQPLPGVNHPAWLLGHLAFAADGAGTFLGQPRQLDDAWKQKFGGGSVVSNVRSEYPDKDTLLRIFEERNAAAGQLMQSVTPEQYQAPNPHARLKESLPQAGQAVAFLMTSHLAIHLGQLSSWRRMIGLQPMF